MYTLITILASEASRPQPPNVWAYLAVWVIFSGAFLFIGVVISEDYDWVVVLGWVLAFSIITAVIIFLFWRADWVDYNFDLDEYLGLAGR